MSHGTEASDRCFKHKAETAPSLIQNGKLVLQPYHIGFIISGSLGLVAIITSIWLISKHLQWYTNKREQRYIVRILFMVPLYALISFLSFLFWNHSTPLILIRDAYEALVLTAFFYLLLMYLSHDPEEQKRIFVRFGLSHEADAIALQKGQKVTKWVLPLGFVKWKPRDGLYFLQLMKWGVLQYCVIRPTSTLAAVILDYIGLYCESSWGLGWGHIYITILMSLSVTVAMYCLIQLYVPVAKELTPHKPLLKLFSIKAVVFLTFWQATFLSVLSMFGIVKDTTYMTAEDVNIGIGAVAECFEMMLFGFIHIAAFSYKPYCRPNAQGDRPLQTPRWRSLGHALDFRETFREIWVGCVYMFDRMRGREPTPDFGVIRENHYEGAFGRSRRAQPTSIAKLSADQKKYTLDDVTYPTVAIDVEEKVEVDVDGRRQWLMPERDRRRGLHPGREKSEGLLEQFDKELEKLGYPTGGASHGKNTHQEPLHPAGRQRSWWRTMYDRISQSGPDIEEEEQQAPAQARRRLSSRWRRSRNLGQSDILQLQRVDEQEIDDRPPPSLVLYPYNTNMRQSRSSANFESSQRQNRAAISDNPLLLPPPLPVPLTLDNVDDDVPLPLRPSDLSRYSVISSPPSNTRDRLPPVPTMQQHQASSRPPSFVHPDQSQRASQAYHGGATVLSTPSGYRGERRSVNEPLIFRESPFVGGPSEQSSISRSRHRQQTHASPPRPNSVPTRRRQHVVPVMPLPLARPEAGPSLTRQDDFHFEYAWSPPHPQPAPTEGNLRPQDSHTREDFSDYPQRRSTHRREPAAPRGIRQDDLDTEPPNRNYLPGEPFYRQDTTFNEQMT
ncbi:hypothetical protein D9619_001707 [Psilocybe cf. subviscida]|uniref:DUF300-domain-containing protein n=1 Tax=Psilocybe cf. subviscida TaxID=2480587 RepID=A0A8H5BGQ4_9AGAR|nr:hypothetical protein D9619_001707 [Psilocybe cf. subviscida]